MVNVKPSSLLVQCYGQQACGYLCASAMNFIIWKIRHIVVHLRNFDFCSTSMTTSFIAVTLLYYR